MDPPTILAIKQAFLASAVRRLDQPLAPSRAWRRRSSSASAAAAAAALDGPGVRLPPKAVDAALDRVNHRLHQHARRVYAPPAVRHVAEQIDRLYSDAEDHHHVLGAAVGVAGDDPSHSGLAPPPDYTDPAVLDALPATWADPGHDHDHDHNPTAAAAAAEALPLEARRYAEQVARLRALAAARTAALRRVQQLRRLAALAAPFAAPKDNGNDDHHRRRLQDRLVTRDSAVEAELERMRVLLARVGGRVAALAATTTAATHTETETQDHSKTVEDASRQRVQALLGLP